jgi:hypothetical protein
MSVPDESLRPDRRPWAATLAERGSARQGRSRLSVALLSMLALLGLAGLSTHDGLGLALERRLAQVGLSGAMPRPIDGGASRAAADALIGPGLGAPGMSSAVAARLGLARSGGASDPAGTIALSTEQSNLARDISIRYRHAIEFSREVVHHAYQSARDARLDPLLVLAIISVESGFDPLAESPAGAQGLMQVLTRVHLSKFQPFGGVQAAFDPVANLRVGTAILRNYVQTYGSVSMALKAYVGAAHADHDSGYAAKVLAARERFAAVAAGRPLPDRPIVSPALPSTGRNDDGSPEEARTDRVIERGVDGGTRVPVLLRGLDDLRLPDQI